MGMRRLDDDGVAFPPGILVVLFLPVTDGVGFLLRRALRIFRCCCFVCRLLRVLRIRLRYEIRRHGERYYFHCLSRRHATTGAILTRAHVTVEVVVLVSVCQVMVDVCFQIAS